MEILFIALLVISGFGGLSEECETGLKVKICGRNLSDKDPDNDASDPFFKFYIKEDEFYVSSRKENTHNPCWDEAVSITYGEVLRIHFRDHDAWDADDDMGWSHVSIADLMELRIGEYIERDVYSEGRGTAVFIRSL